MQRRLIFILLLLLGITFLTAQNRTIVSSKPTNKAYKHTIATEPYGLIFGLGNISYEYRIIKRASLIGSVYFGKMLFVDVNNSYAAFLRYYKDDDPTYGFYFQAGFSHIEMSHKSDKAEASNIYGGLGYRLLKWDHFTLDFGGGISFSSDDKVEFDKRSGNLTQTVTIGGPVTPALSIYAGYSF